MQEDEGLTAVVRSRQLHIYRNGKKILILAGKAQPKMQFWCGNENAMEQEHYSDSEYVAWFLHQCLAVWLSNLLK